MNVFTAVLWGGLIILTAALLIIMRTKWGSSKPISKCVVLSVFAHILLLGYAYATRLIMETPQTPVEEPLRVAVLDHDPPADPNPVQQPWDDVPVEEVRPEVSPLPPQEIDSSIQPIVVKEPDNVAALLVSSPPLTQQIIEDNAVAPVEDQDTSESDPVATDVPQADELVAENPASEFEPPATPPESFEPASQLPLTTEPIQNSSTPQPSAIAGDTNDTLTQDGVNEEQQLNAAPAPANTSDFTAGQYDHLAAAGSRPVPGQFVANSNNDSPTLDSSNPSWIQRNPTPNAHVSPPAGSQSAARSRVAANQLRNQYQVTGATRVADQSRLPYVYYLRFHRDRLSYASEFGATDQSERSVDAALAWIAAQQLGDGRWDASQHGAGKETKQHGHDRQGAGSDADPAVSALALLAFMGAGNTHYQGQYRINVQRGLEYLIGIQERNGAMYGRSRFFARMYCHAMATLAIAEAYALTGDERLKPFVERAVQFTLNSQNPTNGGWRYHPGDEGDMSQFGWHVMSLRSAQMAGVEIPAQSRVGMLRFLQRVSKGQYAGLASYRSTTAPTRTMTAEAHVCRALLEVNYDRMTTLEGEQFILQELPSAGEKNFYYWYYGTLALFQMQSEQWPAWNGALQSELLKLQRKDQAYFGSWDPDTTWGSYGGRVYSTALATMCLEVYYRYLPVYTDR